MLSFDATRYAFGCSPARPPGCKRKRMTCSRRHGKACNCCTKQRSRNRTCSVIAPYTDDEKNTVCAPRAAGMQWLRAESHSLRVDLARDLFSKTLQPSAIIPSRRGSILGSEDRARGADGGRDREAPESDPGIQHGSGRTDGGGP